VLLLTLSVNFLTSRRGAYEISRRNFPLASPFFSLLPPASEAPTGFDHKTNGLVDDATHTADQAKFDEIEQISTASASLYNAQSCRSVIRSTSGGSSQISELPRRLPWPRRQVRQSRHTHCSWNGIIKGPHLVNDRAILPERAFPSTEIQERVPDSEKIRTFRVSLNLLWRWIRGSCPRSDFSSTSPRTNARKITTRFAARYLRSILEALGQDRRRPLRLERQQASLLSFSADALPQ